MRPSLKKHPLAVLRLILGKSQKQMANLIGCATVTVQKIELGSLPLKEPVARRIATETDVDGDWLLRGDPNVPPITEKKAPYTIQAFDKRRKALAKAAFPVPRKVRFAAAGMIGIVLAILMRAYNQKRFFECVNKLANLLEPIENEFGKEPEIDKVADVVAEQEQEKREPNFQRIVDAFGVALIRAQSGKPEIQRAD